MTASDSDSNRRTTTAAAAELSVVADTIEAHRQRVAAVATSFVGTGRDDAITAIHEAERQLLIAGKTLQRALKTIDRS